MIACWDLKEKKVLAVLRKQKSGFPTKEHRDNKIADASIHKYQYHHKKQGSMDRNYFPANNHASQCLLHRYNQMLSTQNHRSQMDNQVLASMPQTLQAGMIRFPS